MSERVSEVGWESQCEQIMFGMKISPIPLNAFYPSPIYPLPCTLSCIVRLPLPCNGYLASKLPMGMLVNCFSKLAVEVSVVKRDAEQGLNGGVIWGVARAVVVAAVAVVAVVAAAVAAAAAAVE